MPKLVLFSCALLASAGSALAGGLMAPGPLAGAAFGPVGLVVAGAAYVAYRVIKARSDR